VRGEEGQETAREGEKKSENAPDTEELSGGGAEGDVGTLVKVDGGLGEHGVVLDLGATERGGVSGDEDELGCFEGI
jgi:hypothetical protein